MSRNSRALEPSEKSYARAIDSVRARAPWIQGFFSVTHPSDSRANPPPLSFPQVVNNGFDTLWESRNKGKLYKHIVGNFPELEEE